MLAEQRIERLPESPIDAIAAYFADHLEEARGLLEGDADALAIILPEAPTDHDDWRRSLARDLARAHTPKRVNVIGGQGNGLAAMLEYLAGAKGVTGQYCPLHD